MRCGLFHRSSWRMPLSTPEIVPLFVPAQKLKEKWAQKRHHRARKNLQWVGEIIDPWAGDSTRSKGSSDLVDHLGIARLHKELISEEAGDWFSRNCVYRPLHTVAQDLSDHALVSYVCSLLEIAVGRVADLETLSTAVKEAKVSDDARRRFTMALLNAGPLDNEESGCGFSREDYREVKKLVKSLISSEAGREPVIDALSEDGAVLSAAVTGQTSQGVYRAVAAHVVARARPYLDLLSGCIAHRMSAKEYKEEVLGVCSLLKPFFGEESLLCDWTTGKDRLMRNIAPLPTWTVSPFRTDESGKVLSVGVHTSVKELLDFLSRYPGWRDSVRGSKKTLGICVSTDGAKLGQGGVLSTVVWVVNTTDLCQSARHTFTVALSSGGDSEAEMRYHHDVIYKELAELEQHGWKDPACPQNTVYAVRVYRVADGKGIRIELGRDSAADPCCCPRCSIPSLSKHILKMPTCAHA